MATMQGEEQKVFLPKLDIEGDNWVMYRDRLLWTMKHNNIKIHITNETAPADYISKGKVGSLEPQEQWECEEYSIRQVLGNTMPDKAFSQIKDTDSVKDAWDILKSAYQDCTAALVADHMKTFRDTKCLEGGNV
jgi:gag-polypeptide of LTR copia-type